MKRSLLVLALILALSAPAFGQFVPGSLQSGMTFEMFQNEIDQSFQANPDFGTLQTDFLFSGLGNPYSGSSSFTLNEMDAFDTSLTGPLMLGYYSAGLLPVPVSAFASLSFTSLGTRPIVSAYTTNGYGADVPVVSGTTTTNHSWIDQSTAYTPTGTVLFSSYNMAFQALTRLPFGVIGLYADIAANNSASDTAAANGYFQTITDTYYVNTAGAGVVPTPVTDYTITTSTTNINAAAVPGAGTSGAYTFTDTLTFGVPFAMRTGALSHTAYLKTVIGLADSSGDYSIAETLHSETAGAASVTDRTVGIDAGTSATDIELNYGLSLPAGTADDKWFASTALGLGLNGQSYTYDSLSRPYDLSVTDAKTPLAGGSHVSLITSYDTGVDFSFDVSGGRLFVYKPASAITFKMAPGIGIGIDTVANSGAAALASSTSYTQVLDASGAYNGAAYNSTTTTYSGDSGSVFTLTLDASLPMGLVLKPEGWVFGIMMGAEPTLEFSSATTKTSARVTTTTVTNYTGTTVNSVNITTTTPVTPGQATTDVALAFNETHYIGLTVPFDGGVRFDLRLNGNLLAFESFTIQAYVPLGK